MPAGSGSVTTTFAASLGPLFVTPQRVDERVADRSGLVTGAAPTLR